MTSEFEDAAEPKDHTKLVWAVVVLVFALMCGGLWLWARPPAVVSQVRFRQILVTYKHGDDADRARALDLITKIRNRIVHGESFAKMAETYSNDPASASRGGDVGYITKGSLDRVIEAYVWDPKTKLHKLSDILECSLGFDLVEVTDRIISKADRYNEQLKLREEENVKAVKTAAQKNAATPSSPAH